MRSFHSLRLAVACAFWEARGTERRHQPHDTYHSGTRDTRRLPRFLLPYPKCHPLQHVHANHSRVSHVSFPPTALSDVVFLVGIAADIEGQASAW